MKFKDLVANSLPRVRGRKSKKTTHAHNPSHVTSGAQKPEFSTCPRYFPHHPAMDSRESSVERSSTVAVVDAPWRENAVYKSCRGAKPRPGEVGQSQQQLTYFPPPPLPSQHQQQQQQQHGMVLSHSADAISSQATMAVLMTSSHGYHNGSKVTTFSDHYSRGDYQHHNISAISESAVNYIGPNCLYHSQHQHHHHHNHNHHYVYHHHHHRPHQQQQQQQQPQHFIRPTPLAEKNHQQPHNTNFNAEPAKMELEKPRKSGSTGFFRKSFASFRAMRKQGNRNKDQDSRQSTPTDENDKCLVCPYPQPQASEAKASSDRKSAKQSRKGLKSLTKSKKKKDSASAAFNDYQSDKSWYSDNDTHKVQKSHHSCGLEVVPYAKIQQFPVRECSMEGSIPRHSNETGSREGSCIREFDTQYHETVSLSGYDSDAAKSRTGRSRSRIKTNPWLPSPQPSLAMGRRLDNCRLRESHEDVMDDETSGCFPRSASFDYHRQLGVSTFQSPADQDDTRRGIQRHRSLTPVDLKLNLSLPKKRTPAYPPPASGKDECASTRKETKLNDTGKLNDLNTNSTRSRPNSVVSPNSEFIALADNIEQLANNISFEYEEMCETPTDGDCTPAKNGDGTAGEEICSKKRRSDASGFPSDNLSDNAHSPDSGIGCLGSCDGDETMAMSNSSVLESSPSFTALVGASAGSQSCSLACMKPVSGSHDFKLNKTGGKPSDSAGKNPTCRYDYGNCANIQVGKNGIADPCSLMQNFTRIVESSSNESLNSAVISESDIDNTSYKYSDTMSQSAIVMGSAKMLNSRGCLMVEERLDIDFRSLPRRGSGSPSKKPGVCGLGRSRTITESDLVSTPLSSRGDPRQTLARMNQAGHVANDVQNEVNPRSDGETLPQFGTASDAANSPASGKMSSVRDDSPFENVALVVNLDRKPGQGVKMAVAGHPSQSGQGRGDLMTGMNKADCVTMDTSAWRETSADGNAGDVMSDTVDACVQTDFLDDYECWERRQPAHLPNLEESFDPVESTRRWLMSGNMQGSADTGYSSQPRDSHVFMEDEAAMLQYDSLSDKSGNSNQNKHKLAELSPTCENKPIVYDESMAIETQSKPSPFDIKTNDDVSKQIDETNVLTADGTANHLFPGIESQIQNVFDQIIRKRNGSSSDETKRHSSDSSTSTLTSDIPGCLQAEDSCDMKSDQVLGVLPQQPEINCSSISEEKEEPDYVNLPSISPFTKAQQESSSAKYPETTRRKSSSAKTHKNGEAEVKCAKCCPSFPYILPLDAQDNKPCVKGCRKTGKKIIDTNLGSFEFVENLADIGQERADYLEFLRDAPLPKGRSKTPVFIIPGFGPIELAFNLPGSSTNIDDQTAKENEYFAAFSGDIRVVDPAGCEERDPLPSLSHEPREQTTSHLEKKPRDPPTGCCHSKSNKIPKTKRDEKVAGPATLAYPCCPAPQHKHGDGCKEAKTQPCHLSSGKRKANHSKHNRCPTVQSYEVDAYSSNNANKTTGCCSQNLNHTGRSEVLTKDNATRNLAERVSLLRREKEIIYRKIQEVQEQELSRQREQLQHQRHLHSQRKEELLETLHDLKNKLEEQSRKLQMKLSVEDV